METIYSKRIESLMSYNRNLMLQFLMMASRSVINYDLKFVCFNNKIGLEMDF